MPVVGLSYDVHTNRFFYTWFKRDGFKRSEVDFGPDRLKAIIRFQDWQSRREKKGVSIPLAEISLVNRVTVEAGKTEPVQLLDQPTTVDQLALDK